MTGMSIAPVLTPHSLHCDVVDEHAVCVLSSHSADVQLGVAPELGMLAFSLRHGGEELLGQRSGLAGYVRDGATMGIPLLHPWANRLGGCGYTFGGRTVALRGATALDDHGLPIHGLLAAMRGWSLVATGADEHRAWVVAELDAARRPDVLAGFPFPHTIRVAAVLSGARVAIETTVRATGDIAVPICFGHHPYLRLPGAPRGAWEVEMPVARRLRLDDRKLPTGSSDPYEPVPGPLAERTYDDAFVVAPGGAPFAVSGGRRRIEVTFEEGYPYAQVFAPADDDVVCFEPMTAPPNALRRRFGPLRAVAPGAGYRARFTVTVRSA
jgi:aldose 1-epimerase